MNTYPDIIEAPRRIDAINSLLPNADVWMRAGQEVHFLPGFHAHYGSSLHAYINPSLDVYPIYFKKTTVDPCGQNKYAKHEDKNENVTLLLEKCRQQKYVASIINDAEVNKNLPFNSDPSNEDVLIEPNDLIIYPNPSDGIFYVKSKGNYKVQKVEVLNSVGIVIKHCTIDLNMKIKLDLKQFQSGIYFLRTVSNDKVSIYKLIKVEEL